MTITNGATDKQDLIGYVFAVGGIHAKLTGWHRPDYLRAGDLLHVDATALSEVVSVKTHRGGSRLIALTDGREICVAGENDLAVFARA